MAKTAADITVHQYRALAEFRHQIRRFLHFSEQAARGAGLEPQQHQLLLAVKGLPGGTPASIGHLAERLQIQHHSAVELLNRLEERGLAGRSRSVEDHREVLINLTPRGERVLRELSLHHRAELRAAGPALVRALEALIPASRNGLEKGRHGDRGTRAARPSPRLEAAHGRGDRERAGF